jgi:hypothetical protein
MKFSTAISTLLLTLFFASYSIGQTNYVEAYYVNNANAKRTGLIKNTDWNRNPTSFSFKATEDGTVESISINEAKEFGALGLFKYLRADIDLDVSSTTANNISPSREPKYEKRTVFLKTLVDGAYNLFEYKDDKTRKYFYSENSEPVFNPLVSKIYSNNGRDILYNNDFRTQLYQLIETSKISLKELRKIEYNSRSLTRFFTSLNSESIIYTKAKSEDWFRLYLRPGVSFNNLDINDLNPSSVINNSISIDPTTSFRFGAQLEFMLPFNNNKWSFTVEPTFHSYSGSQEQNASPGSPIERVILAEADFSSIKLLSAIRYYMYLNNDFTLFLSGGFSFDLWLSQELQVTGITNTDFSDEFRSDVPLHFGIGLMYKKIGLEFNYQTAQDLLTSFNDSSTDYSIVSLILSYRIL